MHSFGVLRFNSVPPSILYAECKATTVQHKTTECNTHTHTGAHIQPSGGETAKGTDPVPPHTTAEGVWPTKGSI